MMLSRIARDRITVVWAVLMIATAISWLLGIGHAVTHEYAGVAILIIAFLKIHFVGAYFMELRNAPRPLLIAFDCWVVTVLVTLVLLFVLV